MWRSIIWMLALVAASSAPASARLISGDISFVRGCWAGRDVDDGSLLMSLGLLPDAREDGAFAGTIFDPRATGPGAYRFSFASDGSALSVQHSESFGARTHVRLPRSEPPPSSLVPLTDEISRQVAAFADGEESGWIVVVVVRMEDGEHLAIYFVHPNDEPGEMYFGGKRETCS